MRKIIIKKHIAVLLQAAVMIFTCAGFSLPALAASYNTAAKLFFEGYYDNELDYYDRMLDADSNLDEDGNRIKTEFIINRRAGASVKVASDTTLTSDFNITIPKGKTLTINKDATLRIYGELLIEGNLENYGTIIIGNNDFGAFSDGVVVPRLSNSGGAVNSGTIKIYYGTLNNKSNGKLENKGVITILTQDASMTGMQNSALTKNGTTTFGTVINVGTINVENSQGTGLRNFSGASFENNGKIYKTKRATIKGTIKGEAVLSK